MFTIGIVRTTPESPSNQPLFNGIEAPLNAAKTAGIDLLLFDMTYIQERQALTFDYEKDIHRLPGMHGEEIADLHSRLRQENVLVGLGLFENDGGGIFSSYLIFDRDGTIILRQKQGSRDWIKETANADYRKGLSYETIRFKERTLAFLPGEDVFCDEKLNALLDLDTIADYIICPANKERDDDELKQRSEIFATPLLWFTKKRTAFLRQGKQLPFDKSAGLDIVTPGNN